MAKPCGQSWTVHNLGRLIKFGVKYMESGFLDMLTNGGPGFADTFKPAIIRFNPFVTSKSAVLPNASAQRVVADGDESLAVGCSEKLESIDYSTFHFDSDPAAFCDPAQILAKKLCQMRVPPSVYTGKMRLMIQAIYGSKRNDYTYAAESAGMDNLVLAGVSLGISTPTAGLYTAPDGSYWLIKIGTNVTYQKLKISGAYQAAIEDEPLSEAYALSRLIPEPGSAATTMAGSSLSSALSGYSGPLAYGWKFNSDGSEASVVVHGVQTGMSGKTFPAGTNSTGVGIKTALLKVVLGWDAVNLHPTFVSVTTVETGLHMPYVQSRLLIPIIDDGAKIMECLIPGSAGSVVNNWTGPLYCYYKPDDVLSIFRGVNGSFETKPYEDGRPDHGVPGVPRINTMSTRSGTYYPARTTWNDSGFTADSDQFVGKRTTQNASSYYLEIEYFESPVRHENSIYSLPSADGVYTRYFWNYWNTVDGNSQPGYRQFKTSANSELYTGIMIIPHGDAEAVVIGYNETITHNEASNPVEERPLSQNYNIIYKIELWLKQSGSWVGKTGEDFPAWSTGQTSVTFGNPDYTDDPELRSRSPIRRGKKQGATLYSSRLATPLIVYFEDSGAVPEGDTIPSQSLDAVVAINATDPYLPVGMTAKVSYSASAKWIIIGDIVGADGWPSYDHAYPVGWA